MKKRPRNGTVKNGQFYPFEWLCLWKQMNAPTTVESCSRSFHQSTSHPENGTPHQHPEMNESEITAQCIGSPTKVTFHTNAKNYPTNTTRGNGPESESPTAQSPWAIVTGCTLKEMQQWRGCGLPNGALTSTMLARYKVGSNGTQCAKECTRRRTECRNG